MLPYCKRKSRNCYSNGTQMEKVIKILGRIGNTEYQNNDRCKVLCRMQSTKTIYAGALKGNQPMVVRKWERK